MSVWQSMEDAIVTALAELVEGGKPMLATVRGRTWRDRKVAVSALLRERLPAAYVSVAGRDGGHKDYRRPGHLQVSVLYASRSERSDDEARLGGPESAGVLAIAESAGTALQDLDLGNNRRLLLVDERSGGGEDGTALWEQRCEVRRQSSSSAPTFGGSALAGSSSEVEVEIGEMKRVSSTFAFPGVDGVFERFAGTRERPIIWRGQLRADDNSALSAMEEEMEQRVREAAPRSLIDPWGRLFACCVATSVRRIGPRGADELTGEALQDFEMHFVQLAQ